MFLPHKRTVEDTARLELPEDQFLKQLLYKDVMHAFIIVIGSSVGSGRYHAKEVVSYNWQQQLQFKSQSKCTEPCIVCTSVVLEIVAIVVVMLKRGKGAKNSESLRQLVHGKQK